MNGDRQTGRGAAGHIEIVARKPRTETGVEVGGDPVAAIFVALGGGVAVQPYGGRFPDGFPMEKSNTFSAPISPPRFFAYSNISRITERLLPSLYIFSLIMACASKNFFIPLYYSGFGKF